MATHVALWQFLLDQDLLSETRYGRLPSDDPLLSLLLDARAADAKTRDGLGVRLVDVGRALAERTSANEVDVVLGIEDDFLPWNAGAWRLTGGPDGAAGRAGGDLACLPGRPSSLARHRLLNDAGTTLRATSRRCAKRHFMSSPAGQ
ncbi:sterol carrier protein domain-containing protein [Kribbella sp. CA-253562]|uniref:sterol carrier protein domain-containing protein n=1 Tax=Kribbella sp. CA-253562 TaxID=3239942 RepID=UPI003D8AE081